jgi:hypothetical protein
MTRIAASLLTASMLALGVGTIPAQAQNARSFISANGLDTNACTRTAPCRTLQKAHDSTNPGGEINMLNPAGYGTVTITKSISIVNDGVGSAGILVPSGGTGITINAGTGDEVNLRGLIIEGAGLGRTGIRFNTGKSLTVENCVIRKMTSRGIEFFPTTTSSLAVSSTFIGANGDIGAFIRPSGTGLSVKVAFSRVELHSNGVEGINLNAMATTGGTISAVAVDSVAYSNLGAGFSVVADAGQAASALLLLRSVSANNSSGAGAVGANAKVRLAQSAMTGNGDGFFQAVGEVLTYGDNYIDGNDSNTGTLTPIFKQ